MNRPETIHFENHMPKKVIAACFSFSRYGYVDLTICGCRCSRAAYLQSQFRIRNGNTVPASFQYVYVVAGHLLLIKVTVSNQAQVRYMFANCGSQTRHVSRAAHTEYLIPKEAFKVLNPGRISTKGIERAQLS